MPPEALAPAQCPGASGPDAASRDAEAFLASAREAAMEKLRRKRRVQKRREEKTAVNASLRQSPDLDATAAAARARPVPPDPKRVSDPKRAVPRLRLRAIVTPGRTASANGDAPSPPTSAADPSSRETETRKNQSGVSTAAVVGDAVLCGTEDGDVFAYRLGDSETVSVSREAGKLMFPSACGDAASVRLIHPVSGSAQKQRVVVAYDSGAWCVFSLRFFRDENSANSAFSFSLSLITACPPHVAFADAHKYRKRTSWSPVKRRPSIGAGLCNASGTTLFVASPVAGDVDVYAWDVASISKADEKSGTSPSKDLAEKKTTTDAGSLFVMRKHTDRVTCLAFLDDQETRVVSGGNDKALVEWRRDDDDDAETQKEKDASSSPSLKKKTWRAARRVAAPGGAIRALCVSEPIKNDGDYNVARVYTAGSDGAVRAWEVSDETGFVLLRTFVGGHDGFGVCVRAVRLPVFSSESDEKSDARTTYEDYVLSGCEGNAGGYWVAGDGSLKLWRAADGRCAQTVSVQRGDVTGIVCFGAPQLGDASDERPNGDVFCRLVTASKDGTVAHFDLETRAREGSKLSRREDDDADDNGDGDGGPKSFAWTRGFL